jgi:hypothetical protein
MSVSGDMANQLMECPTCKGTIEVPVRTRGHPPDSTSFAAKASSDEFLFFQSADIMVTNARFVVGAKTFAMRGITSVDLVEADEIVETQPGNPLPAIIMGVAILLIVVGFVCWMFYDFSFLVLVGSGIIGVLMFICAILLATQQRRVFKIVLKTAGGEVTAYKSFDRGHIFKIIQALNDSIIAQG